MRNTTFTQGRTLAIPGLIQKIAKMTTYLRWRLIELLLLLAVVVLPAVLYAALPLTLATRLAAPALLLTLLPGYLWAGRKADHSRPAPLQRASS